MQLNDPWLFRQQALLDGRWCDADDGGTCPVTNPATGELLGTVPNMGAAETARAIAAAEAAWPAWRAKTAHQRSAVLRAWYDLVQANVDDLAMIMTLEQGKPLAESRGEIAYAASYIEWFAEEGKRVGGDVVPSPWADRRIVVLRQPIGVCAAITPWNFPSAMVTRKAGPALAAGCPMVLKPATATPYSALALAVLAERAGVPAGVFSVLTGSSRHIGGEMTANPAVRKLTFTGSTEVGRELMRQSAPTVKKLSLELGGNAAFIVFDDADLDAAVQGALMSKFRNGGQTCVCANRIYVQNNVYDSFVEKLLSEVGRFKIGNGVDPGVTHGPLIDQAAIAKVEQHIADALERGATLLAGGKRHPLGRGFFQPTVIGDVTAGMLVAHEETFGPLAPLFRFDTDEEVLARANDTEFGLAGYFYTRDLSRAWRIAEGLECGMVGLNTGLISSAVAPFGGIKQSGLGREGSRYGMDDYLVTKYVCMGGIGG